MKIYLYISCHNRRAQSDLTFTSQTSNLLDKCLMITGINLQACHFIFFLYWFPLQDKSADFSLASSVGIKNNIMALLVLGVYEVCKLHEIFDYNFDLPQPGKCWIRFWIKYAVLPVNTIFWNCCMFLGSLQSPSDFHIKFLYQFSL